MPRALRLASSCTASSTRASSPLHARRAAARLGRGPRAARHHEALLRPLHAGDRRARLRAAPRAGARAARRARPRRGAARMSRASSRSSCTATCPTSRASGRGRSARSGCGRRSRRPTCRCSTSSTAAPPLTLSLTPVLCDQLEAPGALDRCRAFLAGIRVESHRRDIASARTTPGEVAALEHSARAVRARARAPRTASTCSRALGRHVAWTSSATHAILPLLATDAGVRLQLRAGIDAHRRRFGDGWRGGLWLPECAYAPWLDALLDEAGVRAVCVDLTDVLEPDAHLRPLRSRGRSAARADRPRDDRARLEPRRLPGGRGVPQLPPLHAAPPPRLGQRRHALRPRPRRGGRGDRDAADFVARDARARRRRRPRRLRARHGAHRRLVARGPAVARGGRRRVRARRAWGSRTSTTRSPVTTRRPRRRDLPVTTWGTPRDLITWSAPPVERHGLADARARRAAHASPRAAAPTRAPSASCSRCSPATGRFSSLATSPSPTAASAPRGHRARARRGARRAGDPRSEAP